MVNSVALFWTNHHMSGLWGWMALALLLLVIIWLAHKTHQTLLGAVAGGLFFVVVIVTRLHQVHGGGQAYGIWTMMTTRFNAMMQQIRLNQ